MVHYLLILFNYIKKFTNHNYLKQYGNYNGYKYKTADNKPTKDLTWNIFLFSFQEFDVLTLWW